MMQQQKLRIATFFATILTVFGSFGVYIQPAKADLTSLVGGATGPAIGAAISCNKEAISSGLSSLFGKGKSQSNTGGGGTETGQSVPVGDTTVGANTSRTAEEAAKTSKKLTCTNAIARAVSQTILKELTVSTINWINTGFQGGGPLYIGDTSTFLKNIGDQSVNQFASVIGFDPVNYPFGKMIVQGLINSTKASFETEARYSLNKVIAQRHPGMTSADFNADFSVGGWDALLSQTQWQNNPIGFNQHASETLANRTANTAYSPAQDIKDQIQRNGGFLDQKKCVKPSDYDAAWVPDSTQPNAPAKNVCQQWMNQTPGSVVSSTLNKALGTTFDQLGLGQDLSTDLTAIFDALINHFVQKGLNALSEETSGGNNGTPVDFDKNKNNQSYVDRANSIPNGGGNSMGSSFLNAGDGFQTNIFDLNSTGKESFSTSEDDRGNPVYRSNLIGIINREMQLINTTDIEASLTAIDPVSKTTIFGWTSAEVTTWKNLLKARDQNYVDILDKENQKIEDLIPAIYQLDYCVPGPHIGWQDEVSTKLERELDGWPKDSSKTDLWQANSKFQKIMDMSGNLNKFSQAISDATQDVREESLYAVMLSGALSNKAPEIKTTVGLKRVSISNTIEVAPNSKVNGYDKTVEIMLELFDRYQKALTKQYSTTNIRNGGMDQPILTVNNTEYANLPTYKQSIIDNKELIEKQKSMIYQLIALGKKIYRLQNNINLDPNSDGTFKGFPGTYTCTNEKGVTIECPGDPSKGYDFYQSQINQVNQTSISKLTEYQKELRRINDTFNILAPDLHSDQDIKEQEALLDTIIEKVDSIMSDGGYLDLCIDQVNNSVINAEESSDGETRLFDTHLMRLSYPATFNQYFPQSFKDRFKKPEGKSFLPDYYFRRGEDPGEVAYMKNLLGNKYNPSKEIRNDDIVTIDNQPIPNALATFEQFLGMY